MGFLPFPAPSRNCDRSFLPSAVDCCSRIGNVGWSLHMLCLPEISLDDCSWGHETMPDYDAVLRTVYSVMLWSNIEKYGSLNRFTQKISGWYTTGIPMRVTGLKYDSLPSNVSSVCTDPISSCRVGLALCFSGYWNSCCYRHLPCHGKYAIWIVSARTLQNWPCSVLTVLTTDGRADPVNE